VSSILLLDFAVKTNCRRFIFASTMSVYGDIDEGVASEDLVARPKSFYAVGKLATEHYLKVFANTRNINFSALRYFNVYGPGQNLENMKQGMASIFLTQLFSDKTPSLVVKGSLDRFRDFIFIDDVVDITVRCLNAPEAHNKIINVGTGEKTTVREILKVIMREAKIEKPISIEGSTPGDQFGIRADTSLLKSFYKKDLISFDEGMRLFVRDIQQR
jgi:UDP-glucose 4-epimerase